MMRLEAEKPGRKLLTDKEDLTRNTDWKKGKCVLRVIKASNIVLTINFKITNFSFLY